MRRTKFFALSLALATAMTAGVVLPVSQAEAAKPKAPKAPEVSKEFRAAIAPLDTALTAKTPDYAAALAAAEAAIPVAKPGYEMYYLGNQLVAIGGKTNDNAVQLRGVRMMLDSGGAPAEDLPKLNYFVGSLSYDSDNYADARKYLGEAKRMGYVSTDIDALLAEAYFQEDMNKEGLAILRDAILAREAAGTKPVENWYRRGTSVALQANLAEETAQWGSLLVRAYPSVDNWRSALVIMRESMNLASQDNLDIMRLMRRTGSLASERDYGDYVEAADPRRLPGEVLAVLNEGADKGIVKRSDIFFGELYTAAEGRLSADKADLPASDRDARNAANGVSALATGDAYMGYGQFDKAADMYRLALSKGGVDSNRANMRLGIALAETGDTAGAKASFAAVTGATKSVADMWTIWLDGKTAAPAAAVAPAS